MSCSIVILSYGDLFFFFLSFLFFFFRATYFRITFLHQFLGKWWKGVSESYLSDACA